MAYMEVTVSLHAKVRVRIDGQLIETTPGRIFFNDVLPKELGFYNEVIDRKTLGRLVDTLYRRFGTTRTAEVLDEIKRIGFAYATKSGTTVGITDIARSEEHTSELQSRENLVCRLLLEKTKREPIGRSGIKAGE